MENEAVGAAVVEVFQAAVDHGVGQPTHSAHQGQRAVAQAVELGQAARLEARGQQNHVGPRNHAVRQGFVVTNDERHVARVALCAVAQRLLYCRIARAQHRELPAALHQLVHHSGQQVQALLLGQAADHRKQQRIGARCQAHALL